ncbi:hypothetical protein OG585_34880 [Streptomyces sp. NBC_01340]|uniref:hypothetical protein n=1 Tax=unclassified Streptomyces TaxID=2593676 RepID=UPI0022584D6D|nr:MULTISPECIES: hypothetical protein [unclassified Streptomyces]MCX4457754.1 hypothetical protein [Streptomyces sp. NBC_01719]MCX4497111.1 hypothetical protein [Streptomyces sp. NBC_01728]MCX4588353.1 hypothetical protein [Streptomyces sp. NBC_01549]WSI41976.1 hypothetical protein OG585_34880 [Streptomyces sp. NBC_01340]
MPITFFGRRANRPTSRMRHRRPQIRSPEATPPRLSPKADGFGDVDQRKRIYEAEQAMEEAAEKAGVGEVDGNEFGGGEAAVYAYGPDADALFKVLEPTLRSLPFRPAHVILRRGNNETRVDL